MRGHTAGHIWDTFEADRDHDRISRVRQQFYLYTPNPPRPVSTSNTKVVPEKNAYDDLNKAEFSQNAFATSSATGPTGFPIGCNSIPTSPLTLLSRTPFLYSYLALTPGSNP